MGGIVRMWSHKACCNFVIYSQDHISGMDNESGENESYGMEFEMPASTETEETTSPLILDHLRAVFVFMTDRQTELDRQN